LGWGYGHSLGGALGGDPRVGVIRAGRLWRDRRIRVGRLWRDRRIRVGLLWRDRRIRVGLLWRDRRIRVGLLWRDRRKWRLLWEIRRRVGRALR
jgi:hypothetical protein